MELSHRLDLLVPFPVLLFGMFLCALYYRLDQIQARVFVFFSIENGILFFKFIFN